MSENITEKRLTILEYFDAYISHHYQPKTFLGPFVLLSLFYLIFSDIKMLFLELSFILYVLQSLGRNGFLQDIVSWYWLDFFSISIMNVSMLDSNFLESYVTPALPEIVSMHKVRLEFPGNWWSYIFVETKKRLHKFCPCSVYTYTNFNSSLQFPFSFNVLTHKISFCPKSKCKSCPHYGKTRIL